ncbi:16699_t:CDS:2 [Gigaspora rosea]|nr:16699_t:CDS:2 [Gigaspora rosea]
MTSRCSVLWIAPTKQQLDDIVTIASSFFQFTNIRVTPTKSSNLQTTPTRLSSPGDKYIIQSRRYPEEKHLDGSPTPNFPGFTIFLNTFSANAQKPAMES